MMVIQDLDPKFKMAVMPIYMVKTIQMTSPEPLGRFGSYIVGGIWGTSLYKKAKIIPVGS